MDIIKQHFSKETAGLFVIYVLLFVNAVFFKDTPAAVINAFFGITYTVLAGKGNPCCYLFGVCGSAFYAYLAYDNALWGNLFLYGGYYIPMQITGYFKWQKNLKTGKYEIIKTSLSKKQALTLSAILAVSVILLSVILSCCNDKSPYIDGITTVLSIAGMYLTVKRCIEQWVLWIIVNGLSFIMWLKIALSGTKIYSTLLMWSVYFILAFYFYLIWRKELKKAEDYSYNM